MSTVISTCMCSSKYKHVLFARLFIRTSDILNHYRTCLPVGSASSIVDGDKYISVS